MDTLPPPAFFTISRIMTSLHGRTGDAQEVFCGKAIGSAECCKQGIVADTHDIEERMAASSRQWGAAGDDQVSLSSWSCTSSACRDAGEDDGGGVGGGPSTGVLVTPGGGAGTGWCECLDGGSPASTRACTDRRPLP